ncbi:MAG: hypothetical protein JOZ72_08390 [Alphaproteobacteria bacterium]|nr:hypothetical protein [Alphaproteobacteria bacterium]
MRSRLLAVAVLAFAAAPAAAADDAWVRWTKDFDTAITACGSAEWCLEKAFSATPLPPPEQLPQDPRSGNDQLVPYAVGNLIRDFRAGNIMLNQPIARYQLQDYYEIAGTAYLGTGFSVPVLGHNYQDGLQREFLAPNLCAQAMAGTSCKARQGRIWTWRFDPATALAWLDKSLPVLLKTHKPISGGPGFGRHRGDAGENALIPPLVVRYGTMTPDQYKGTLGKPGVHRVFLADYPQARTKTVRGFILATGSPDPEAALKAGKSLFIWVYAPGPEAQVVPASWEEVFKLLDTLKPPGGN